MILIGFNDCQWFSMLFIDLLWFAWMFNGFHRFNTLHWFSWIFNDFQNIYWRRHAASHRRPRVQSRRFHERHWTLLSSLICIWFWLIFISCLWMLIDFHLMFIDFQCLYHGCSLIFIDSWILIDLHWMFNDFHRFSLISLISMKFIEMSLLCIEKHWFSLVLKIFKQRR